MINFSLGKGDWLVKRCHAYGGKVIATVTTEKYALAAVAYFGAATPRLKAATEQGDLVHGMQFIGQSQGLIHDSPTAQVLIARIIVDAQQTWVSVGSNIQY